MGWAYGKSREARATSKTLRGTKSSVTKINPLPVKYFLNIPCKKKKVHDEQNIKLLIKKESELTGFSICLGLLCAQQSTGLTRCFLEIAVLVCPGLFHIEFYF